MLRFGQNPALRLAGALALLVFVTGSASAQGSLDGYRAKMEQWVETRRILSKERADWEVERQTLRATRDLLRDEKKALEAEIQALEESSTAADDERRVLLLERGGLQGASAVLAAKIREMEVQVLGLVPQLPEPLQQKLEPLLVQIPQSAATESKDEMPTTLGPRLMSVLGVLAQVEKFNSTATFVGETRVDGDEKIQVRTLYWGVGQAIYADTQGRSAGIGRPGPDGWEFTDDPDLADDAAELLDIYEGNTDAVEFVSLPVEIRE